MRGVEEIRPANAAISAIQSRQHSQRARRSGSRRPPTLGSIAGCSPVSVAGLQCLVSLGGRSLGSSVRGDCWSPGSNRPAVCRVADRVLDAVGDEQAVTRLDGSLVGMSLSTTTSMRPLHIDPECFYVLTCSWCGRDSSLRWPRSFEQNFLSNIYATARSSK